MFKSQINKIKMLEHTDPNPNQMSPSQRANLARKLGQAGAFFDGTVPENTHYLTEGGQHELEAEQPYSHRPNATKHAQFLNEQITKRGEQ